LRQLSPLDAQFLAFEDARNYGHVGGLGIYDPSTAPGGTLTLEQLSGLFAERLHMLPPFRERLAPVPLGLDYPYWVEDPDFDLEYHLRELALPSPGTDRQLGEQVARLHARPLDRSRPLWECYLISGLSERRVALFTKIHHAAVDGLSGAEILSVLLDLDPAGRDVERPSPPVSGIAPPGQWEMLARGLLGLPGQPVRALRALPRTIATMSANPALRTVPGTAAVSALARRLPGMPAHRDGGLLERPSLHAPRTVFNGPLSAHRRVSFASLPLPAAKAIKNHFGGTVNDVVVTLCAGALRSWLQDRGELPHVPLIAMVPVSVRTPEEAGTFGNRISAMMVALPTDEPDPVGRLHRAQEVLSSAKTRHRAMPASVLADSSAFIPPAVVARASRVALTLLSRTPLEPVANVVVSNVPGSPLPLYCAGALLTAHYPISAITDSVGLNITILSYRDRLNVGIVADRTQIGDAWPLADLLRVALDELTDRLPDSGRAPGRTRAASG
jgi:WS/DGAT/MGAT family acyltransferase